MVLVVGLFILIACNTKEKDKIETFIPGVYVCAINNEFSKGDDTLFITLISNEGNSYRIVRHTSFQRLINGKKLPIQRKSEVWTAIYNHEDKLLFETKNGKVLSFNPDKDLLFVGSNMYRKINR